MGRIKTQQIKRVTLQLMKEYGDQFKEDFNENKLLVSKYTDVKSKKQRNVIAGYATRIVKNKEE